MSLTIVMLDGEENFLKFLDPDLCSISQSHEEGGLKTLSMEYKFQDLHEDKQLFVPGNKIWVSGRNKDEDCLYVINTEVTNNVYKDNSFKFEIEEKLVELNFAPVFTQTEITAANKFNIVNTNGEQEIVVDWNALNYLFGSYFNIGVVQKCLSEYASRVSLSGAMNRMSVLRSIEEQTGNVFVTRYEKDLLNNTIHPYLDFLNPNNLSKDWVFNIEYDFKEETVVAIYDENDNETSDTFDDVEDEDDVVKFDSPNPVVNIDPEDVTFRFVDKNYEVLTTDTDENLEWIGSDVGFEDQSQAAIIQICKVKNNIGLSINEKNYAVAGENDIEGIGNGFISVENDPANFTATLPDDCYFEIYDHTNDMVLFRTCVNSQIGTVHEEILSFAHNVENVEFGVDESETYSAISPILSLDMDGGSSNGLSRNDMGKIINAWRDLSVTKGSIVPMIVEKITVKASSLEQAKRSLGSYTNNSGANTSLSRSNYWSRPLKPNDNIDSNTAANSTWEFWKATAYWKAPYTKKSKEFHVSTDDDYDISYSHIHTRADRRDQQRKILAQEKMGNVETSDEDIFAIFNDVCMKLKEKQTRKVNIDVDVANLRKGQFNEYNVHDKVYVKLPDSDELVSARVVKTVKDAHDIAKNSIELSNYSINTIKTIQDNVVIHATNTSFKYPGSKNLTVQLENTDYNNQDEYSVQYPANKLLTFTLYKVENNSASLTGKVYTKRTDSQGKATISMKYNPGDYEIQIGFGGDEEYSEAFTTIEVNVSGVIESTVAKKKTTKSKTTTKGKKTVQTYYDKKGRTPDKSKILAIGKRSVAADKGSDTKFYETQFKNKCPQCGKKTLVWGIYWAGDEHKSKGKFSPTGQVESGSNKGKIFCTNHNCEAEFSVLGNPVKNTTKKLSITKDTVVSKKSRAYSLRKGELKYAKVAKSVASKKNTGSTAVNTSGIAKDVINKAISVAGGSKGLAAIKKITRYVGGLKYVGYEGFKRSPSTVMKKGGNCCDQTRLLLTMIYVVVGTSDFTLKYVHIHGNGGGHVFAKVITKGTGKWRYIDPTHSPYYGTCLKSAKWGYPPGSQTTFSVGSTPF